MRLLVACVVVLGMGCGSQAKRDLEEIEKRACSCGTDKKCGDFLADDLGHWVQDHKDDRVSDEDAIKSSLQRTLDCLMTAGVDPSVLSSRLMP